MDYPGQWSLVRGLLAAVLTLSPHAGKAVQVTAASVAESHFTLPIHFEAQTIARVLDGLLPTGHAEQGVFFERGIDFQIASGQLGVHRSGATSVRIDGACFEATVPLAINNGRVDWTVRLKVPLLGGVKLARHGMPFGGSATVRARACPYLDTQWSLVPNIAADLHWVEGAWLDLNPPIGRVRVNVEERVNPAIRAKLVQAVDRITSQASGLAVRTHLANAWAAAQLPFAIHKDPLVVLNIEPLSAGVGPPVQERDRLVFNAVFAARLLTTLGAGTSNRPPLPLPANSGAPAEAGMKVTSVIRAPFVRLNEQLAARWQNSEVEMGDGHRMLIRRAVLSAARGNRLMAQAELSATFARLPGSVSGWITVTGKPRYDDARRQLSMTELELEVATTNPLAGAIVALLHEQIVEHMQRRLVWDTSGFVDPLRVRFSEGFRNEPLAGNVWLDARFPSITLSDVSVAENGLSMTLTAQGSGTIHVKAPM